jgi:hypothetical protein
MNVVFNRTVIGGRKMHTIPIPRWFEGQHKPHGHEMAVKLEHVVRDERFWPIVVTLLLLALLVGVAIWAGLSGGNGGVQPPRPYYPFTY